MTSRGVFRLFEEAMADVAALYVDPNGPYPHIPRVDCWDASRDADRYPGDFPVVAHPPCGPWGRLRHLSKSQAAHHAPLAVALVRLYGGVLEHPQHSQLWDAMWLPGPGEPADRWGGYTEELDQCRFGHVARKMTWIYCVRVPRELARFRPPDREPTHWIAGFRVGDNRKRPEKYKQSGSAVPHGIKICSAQQRRRTPPAFAEWLVSLARASKGNVT